jgi:hypothetical protein
MGLAAGKRRRLQNRPRPFLRRGPTASVELGQAELAVRRPTGRYHQYRRPPTGRPVAPRIHKTAPITNKMIPSVVRIPMPVSHPSRSKISPRMSTRLPPSSTSRACAEALGRPDSGGSSAGCQSTLAELASAGWTCGGRARCDDAVARPFAVKGGSVAAGVANGSAYRTPRTDRPVGSTHVCSAPRARSAARSAPGRPPPASQVHSVCPRPRAARC